MVSDLKLRISHLQEENDETLTTFKAEVSNMVYINEVRVAELDQKQEKL